MPNITYKLFTKYSEICHIGNICWCFSNSINLIEFIFYFNKQNND